MLVDFEFIVLKIYSSLSRICFLKRGTACILLSLWILSGVKFWLTFPHDGSLFIQLSIASCKTGLLSFRSCGTEDDISRMKKHLDRLRLICVFNTMWGVQKQDSIFGYQIEQLIEKQGPAQRSMQQ